VTGSVRTSAINAPNQSSEPLAAGVECEIEARRVAEPAFWGPATHEFAAVIRGTPDRTIAASIRYKAPHAVDLGIREHREALEQLIGRLEAEGWTRSSDVGRAAYNVRFARWSSFDPSTAQPRSSRLASLYEGLTKHTKRLVILLAVELGLAVVADAIIAGSQVMSVWPSLVSVAVAIVWILAATDDFRMGTHKRIPVRVEGEGMKHPLAWYQWFISHVVYPNRALFGWLIPGSMYVVAIAYLGGIFVQLAAIGALFLLANMFLFLNLRRLRDDFLVLAIGQIFILVTNPGGLPAIAKALGLSL
jgi:hypothetical protein